ncbi:MAG: cytosine permease [Burkholderiaceae bacterium]|nr:cytosine permease [Burkholderiaceae bacterium]
MISVPSLLIGSTLVAGLPFWDALLAGFLGFCVVVAFMSLESVAAVEQRLDTVELASSAFGRTGANLVVGLALGISLLGWFGVQSGVAGSSIAKISKISFGLTISSSLASLLVGLAMMLTAVFGFKYLKWLNFIAVPCKVLLVVYAVLVAFQSQSFDVITNYRPDPAHRLDFLTAIGLSIGFFSVGGVISPDYARHANTRLDAILGSVLGLLPAALGLAACGAMLAIIQNTYDIVEIYAKLGMPVLALSVLIIATWTTNVMNAYSSGLAINQVLHWPAERRQLATLIAGVLGSLLAASGIFANFMGFLMLLTLMVPPIAGVLVSDYWIARSYTSRALGGFNKNGITAWGAGVASMLLVTHPLRSVLGIVVSGAVYLVMVKLRPAATARALT